MTMPRSCGILLHPTSLPGSLGIGSLGEEAFRFLGFLERCGATLWQVLPLSPTGYGDSPYQSFSSFAGNPLLIDLESLVDCGLLKAGELAPPSPFPGGRVDYGAIIPYKRKALERAAKRFFSAPGGKGSGDFERFRQENGFWLPDYALFAALKDNNGGRPWNEWTPGLRRREPAELKRARTELSLEIRCIEWAQFTFFTQWKALKEEAARKGIRILGDLPIFVAYDSADVWRNQEIFHLDEGGRPLLVAGVPPDYFSATGQLWGNPLYRWDRLKETGYQWWIERARAALKLYDLVRLDHFRGFLAYWEIPAGEETAVKGRWVPGPGEELFAALERELGALPFIAEDLGVITPDVEELRDRLGFPGMKVLQFAFEGKASNPFLPHNLKRRCLVYTGTHDNDTTRGWYAAAPEEARDQVRRYLGRDGNDISWDFIRLALATVADMAVVPLQDLLNLGSDARMNFPSRPTGNWQWRIGSWPEGGVALRFRGLADLYGRLPPSGLHLHHLRDGAGLG